MSTPSNFYKHSAYSYAREFNLNSVLENLHAYRVASGEVTDTSGVASGASPNDRITDEGDSSLAKNGKRPFKRLKHDSSLARVSLNSGKSNYDGGESPLNADPHADYLRRASLEDESTSRFGAIFSSQQLQSKAKVTCSVGCDPYDKDLEESDQLKICNEGLGDGRTVGEVSKTDESPSNGVIKHSFDQRFAGPGEPICCRCGRYGEYICDQTGDDVCSLDCKNEVLLERADEQRKNAASTPLYFVSPTPPAGALQIPEVEPDKWDFQKHRWTYRQSSLSTFRCWMCKRPGHLPQDCTATLGMVSQSPADPTHFKIAGKPNGGDTESTALRALYQRCKKLGAAVQQGCKSCGRHTNLAACIDCSDYFCDSAGHLTGHLLNNPQHRQLYSFKLRRLVKCCKRTCAVTDVMKLYVCQFCFSKAFDKFYSMYTATWKGDGLKLVCNAVCCKDHFDWHRMNCPHADVEDSGHLITKDDMKRAQLSEFLF